MKSRLTVLLAVALLAGRAWAIETGAYCPPAQQWVDVVETVKVQVPVTTYVDEPYTYTTTRMVPTQQVVNVPQGRWINERRTVPCTRTEYVNEPYTVYETRTERRPETRTRRVTRTVRETEQRVVTETVYDRSCDPCGRSIRVPRTVTRTVSVPVKRKVCVEEPYTVNVKHCVRVPVTKYRRVARSVPATREVNERRYVTETVQRTVTTMRPVQETVNATRKRAVCTTREEERQVTRRVLVPAPAPVVAPVPACPTSYCG